MNSLTKNLAFCAFLGASGSVLAAPVYFTDGQFTSGKGTWAEIGPTTFSYPATDGNPDGYGVMNTPTGQWGIWVAYGNSFKPLADLGLTAGNGYHFIMDMRIEDGSADSNIGGLKLEWDGAGDTGDMRIPYLGAGWHTYTFDRIIPAGAKGIKVVPLWGGGSTVGFDNIGFESVPYYVAPLPPPPPSDVVHQNAFTVAGTNWGEPTFGGAGVTGSRTWSDTEGNPAGATVLTVANPAGAPGDAFFTYTATGVDFGTGPVEISFDAKLLSAMPGTAIHVRYNGNFVGAIQGAMNQTTYSTITRTFNLDQGFTATNTFTLQFQYAMGAVAGSGGTVAIDNILVKTNLPPSASVPFTAAIATATKVSWTAASAVNSYQPQRSIDDLVWTNLGPEVVGNEVSAAFDDSAAPFYRVLESVPGVQEAVINGGFESDDGFEAFYADGWDGAQSQPANRILTDFRTGVASMQLKVLNAASEPNGSEVHQNVFNAGGSISTGSTYTLTFWAKQISSGPSYVQEYRVSWLAESGAEIVAGAWQTFAATVGGTWEQKTLSGLVAPAGATTAFIQIVGKTGAVAGGLGEVLIDDVSLAAAGFGTPTVIGATTAPAFKISWHSTTGKNYQVQTSGDLGSWSNAGGVIPGDGLKISVYDAMVDPMKFYRVARLP